MTALRVHNYPYIKAELVDWGLPAFSSEILSCLKLRFTRFQESFGVQRDIGSALVEWGRLLSRFRTLVQRDRGVRLVVQDERVVEDRLWINGKSVVDGNGRSLGDNADVLKFFEVGAELVVRYYILDLFKQLAKLENLLPERQSRMAANKAVFSWLTGATPVGQPPGPRFLSDDEANGFCGLSYEMIQKLIPRPNLYVPRRKLQPRYGTSRRMKADSYLWVELLAELFQWLRASADAKPVHWEKLDYWVLGHDFIAIVLEEHGDAVAKHFASFIPVVASTKLWTVPQWQVDRFFNLTRPKEANSLEKKEALAQMTALE